MNHENREGRSSPRRRILTTAALVTMVLLAGASESGGGDVDLTNEGSAVVSKTASDGDIPTTDAPSARTFRNAVEAFPIHEMTRAAPEPSSLEALIDRSEMVVRGRIAEVAVIERPWAPQPDLPNPAAEIVVRSTVTDVVDLGSSDTEPTSDPLDWEITAWQGDPAEASEIASGLRDEVGSGPVGGEVILYLSPRAANHALADSSPAWFAVSGLLESGGTVEVLGDADAGPLAGFDDLAALEAATRQLASSEP